MAHQSVERQLLNLPGSGWVFRTLRKNEVVGFAPPLGSGAAAYTPTRAGAKTFVWKP